jgi:uncharacterized damage-inducible protein DinB
MSFTETVCERASFFRGQAGFRLWNPFITVMRRTDIERLLSYNEWANARILACAERLTEEQYTAPLVSSFPTIRDTLSHIVSAEWVWVQRWKGVNPRAAPKWATDATPAQLRAALHDVEAQRRDLLQSTGDADLDRPISFVYLSGAGGSHTLMEVLLHVVNHSTFHRGQIVTMLRQVGAEPVPTDIVVYFSERTGAERAS